MSKIDLTYSGKMNVLFNAINPHKLDVNYTIDGETGETTTTSLLVYSDKETFFMITFNYQDLKKIVERRD